MGYIEIFSNNISYIKFIVTHEELIGIQYTHNLQKKLVGQICILLFSIWMKEIFNIHNMFYNDHLVKSQDKSSEELEVSNPLMAPLLNSTTEKQTGEKVIFDKYIAVSILDDWPKLTKLLEAVSYLFSLVIFFYIMILSCHYRLGFSLFFMLAIYCYYFSKVNSAAITLFQKKDVPKKISECNFSTFLLALMIALSYL